MKKIITAFILMMVTAIAFALPSPKLIEESLMYGDFNRARGMVQEVLREKPESARAHLLYAYILAKADKNAVAASNELDMAIRLDKKGDVKNSPLIGKVSSEIQNIKPVIRPAPNARSPEYFRQSAPVVVTRQPVYEERQVVVQKEGTSTFTKIVIFLVIIALLIVIFMWLNGSFEPKVVVQERIVYANNSGGTVPHDAYTTRLQTREHVVPQVVHSTPVVSGGGGTTIINNGGGGGSGTNGLLTGMLVADMMHHSHHSHGGFGHGGSYNETYGSGGRVQQQQVYDVQDSTPVQPAVSYESQRQSFSSGQDNSFDEPERETTRYESPVSSGSGGGWDAPDVGGGSDSWDD